MSLIRKPQVYRQGDGFQYEEYLNMCSNPCPEFVYTLWEGATYRLEDKALVIAHAGARYLGIEPDEVHVTYARGVEFYRGETKILHAIYVIPKTKKTMPKAIQIGECLEHQNVLETCFENAKKYLTYSEEELYEHPEESRLNSNYAY
jgi:hypothetical protein